MVWVTCSNDDWMASNNKSIAKTDDQYEVNEFDSRGRFQTKQNLKHVKHPLPTNQELHTK